MCHITAVPICRGLAWGAAFVAGAMMGLACGGQGTGTQPSCQVTLPSACPTPAPTYSGDAAPIFATHCTLCHSPGGVQANHPLGSYAELRPQASTIIHELTACLMPPATEAPLTDAEVQTLLTWMVGCGAPND